MLNVQMFDRIMALALCKHEADTACAETSVGR